MTDLIKLRELAGKATPGPWTIEPHGKSHALYAGRTAERHGLNLMYIGDGDGNFESNTAFIAAANPATIIALFDALEAANKRIAGLERALKLNDELLLLNARK